MRIYYLLLAYFLGASLAYAQTDTAATQLQLKTLSDRDLVPPAAKKKVKVVTASRSGGVELEDIPVTVYIISKEEIRLNGYTTLVDVLKSVPGVRVSQPGGGDNGELFMLRGNLGNGYAKILLNSIPLQPSVKGSLGIGEQLPIAQAEKIEIIYGPSGTIYGSGSMVGTINIITEKVQDGVMTSINAITGPDGYRHTNFMLGGKAARNKDVLSYTIYGNYGMREDMSLNGHNTSLDAFQHAFYGPLRNGLTAAEIESLRNTIPPDEQLSDIYRAAGFPGYQGSGFKPEVGRYPQRSYLLGASVNYRNIQFGFNEMYRQDHSSLGANPVIFSHHSPKFFIGEKTTRWALNYDKSWNKISVTLNASYLRYRLDTESSLGSNYATNGQQRFQSYIYQASDDIMLEGLVTYRPSKNWDWLLGATVQRSSNLPQTNDLVSPFNANDYKPFSSQIPALHPLYGNFGYNPIVYPSSSIFLQGFYHKNKWSLIFGGRMINSPQYDDVNVSDNGSAIEFSDLSSYILPRLGVLYKLSESSSLRFSLANGFRFAPANLAFSSLALPGTDFETGEFIPNSINYQVIPNPNLGSEVVSYLELGYRYIFSEKIYADIGMYSSAIANQINSTFVSVSTDKYPNAGVNHIEADGTGAYRARQWVNTPNNVSFSTGIQAMLRFQDILPKYELNVDAFLKLATGGEVLPSGETLNAHRGEPTRHFQLNLSAKPVKNVYIRLESNWMNGWLRRAISNLEESRDPHALIDGYFCLDGIVRYQFSKNLQGFVKIRNAFDATYSGVGPEGQDIDTFIHSQLSRNIQLGITFNR